MTTRQLAAQIPVRDIAVAAYILDMKDASKAEVAKCCILIQAGYSPEDAKSEVLAMRKPVTLSADNTGESKVFGVMVPEHWLEKAIERHPGLTPSELFRYSLLRITESHEDALSQAKRSQGRPRKQVTA